MFLLYTDAHMKATSFAVLLATIALLVLPGALTALHFIKAIGPHRLSLGPECYYLKRERQGGTWQNGWFYGGRITYDRTKANGFYAGALARAAGGVLQGETASGATLKSNASECAVEGDLGWTFGFCIIRPLLITPFVGYGYFKGVNDFKSPSPLTLKFTDRYGYTAGGIFSNIEITSCISLGLNFRAKWMSEPKETVSGDPDNGDLALQVGEHWLYEAEVPLNYGFSWCNWCCHASLVPFWERRDYGGRENFPFDFIETRYTIYGLRLLLGISY